MKIKLETKSGVFTYTGDCSEPILFSGLSAGLSLPYECATGTCGSCRARVMDGSVEMAWPEAPGAAKLKRDKGDVLMCQARANSDCVLRVPANVTQATDLSAAPKWRVARIAVARQLTADVIHFDLTLSSPMTFKAGQFAVVETPDVLGGRAYSMVNYVEGTNELSFVVKRKPGGGFSEWLFANELVGKELKIFGPLGAATFGPEDQKDFIGIAGGSGIAGIMSILERATLTEHFRKHKGYIFFGVRTLADGFYVKELADYVDKAQGALEVTLALSDEAPASPTHPEFPQVRLDGGFVHEAAKRAMEGRYGDNAMGYVAGPPPMVDGALRLLLTEARLPPQSIRYDKFA
ncbi:2Fe-2S iron-sulfur cluster binding domain-containing protein [Filomicrobium sp.]|uniref:2Fe-2S iron-sulfur cluster binding domain-containing protein n=1 Tax=Filomicrobium sp. TaxID=2024831 RepID=UPI0025846345|nr:2Fe-2S iron-sulfur cluster binding domain-containing protein [Filomicrobium sp.]MCV0369911.1 2Fe-2S iron-sulfur cluster binding domain-containing protein [Filomicrobium sp.]